MRISLAAVLLFLAGGCASLLDLERRANPSPTAQECMQACLDDRDACYLSGRNMFECSNDLRECIPGCQGVYALPVDP
jgi:hypothetical protein